MKSLKKLIIPTVMAFAALVLKASVFADDEPVYFLADGADSDYLGISIDGNYDDWSDKPYSKIQYPWDDGNRYHEGSLYRDGDYVYLNIKMSDLSYTQFNGYNYRFTVDGQEKYVVAVPPDGTSVSDGNTPLVIRDQNGYSVIDNAGGVVTREAGHGDEWELKIPLSFFTDGPESVREVTFYTPNLGPQELVSAGTDTGAVYIAGIGFAVAAAGFVYSYKKKGGALKRLPIKKF